MDAMIAGDFRVPGCPVILIIEDDRAVAEALRAIVVSRLVPPPAIIRDYPDVVLAHAALDTGEMPYPDLVLLDPGLPETQGIESLRALLQHPALSDGVPIIVVSGTIAPDTADVMLSMGADAYIPKGTENFAATLITEIYRQCAEAREIRAIVRPVGKDGDG